MMSQIGNFHRRRKAHRPICSLKIIGILRVDGLHSQTKRKQRYRQGVYTPPLAK